MSTFSRCIERNEENMTEDVPLRYTNHIYNMVVGGLLWCKVIPCGPKASHDTMNTVDVCAKKGLVHIVSGRFFVVNYQAQHDTGVKGMRATVPNVCDDG